MKNIIVKVNNATQTIAEHQVVTKDGQPTVVQATHKVNYELVDQATGRAPDHIITKRVGKDLHVSMEASGKDSDLIIEGYYDEADSALIGMAEDGSYYYYVPDTGEVADYVTELAPGDIEGQALGGNAYQTPYWVGAAEEGGFAWLPWLVGLAGVGALIAALDDNDDDDKTTPPTTGPENPIEVPPEDVNVETLENVPPSAEDADGSTVITGSAEPNTQIVIKDKDGNIVGKGETDAEGNFTTVTDKPLEDGMDYDVIAQDDAGNQVGDKDTVTGDLTDPITPDLIAHEDGSVTAEPVDENAVEMTVEYTDENDQPQKVEVEKGIDGKWTAKGELPEGVTVDPETGKVTLAPDAVKDGSEVTAEVKDHFGQDSSATTQAGNDLDSPTAPGTPELEAKPDGGIEMTPSKDADKGKVDFTDEAGNNQNVEIEKDPDTGEWKPVDPEAVPPGVTVDPDTGTVVVPPDAVQDGSDVHAENSNNNGTSSSDTTAGNDIEDTPAPDAPDLVAKPDGGIEMTPSEDADNGQVDFTDEAGNDQTVEIEKDPNTGEWAPKPGTQLPPGVTVGPDTGTITIPPEGVQDGSTVTGENSNGNGSSSSEVTAGDNDPNTDDIGPEAPDLVANDDGSVVMVPSKEADKATVDFTDENNQPQKVDIVKDPETGEWVTAEGTELPPGVSLNPETGNVTIEPDAVLDGSLVEAENSNDKGSAAAETTAGNDIVDTTAPDAPVLDAKPDGSVEMTPSEDADNGQVDFTDEAGNDQTVEIEKDPDTGEWQPVDPGTVPPGVTVDPETGTVVIPPDAVEDGSDVHAENSNEGGTSSSDTTAGNDIEDITPPAAPVIVPNVDGSVTVTPDQEDAVDLTVDFTDEDGQPQKVEIQKDQDGKWTPTNELPDGVTVNPDTGEVDIHYDGVEDGSEVMASNSDEHGNTSSSQATAGYDPVDGPNSVNTQVVVDDITEDNIINAEEAGSDIPVTGTVTGKFTEGDKVTVTVNGKEFEGTVDAEGKFEVSVPGADLAADPDTKLEVVVSATDNNGNTGEIAAEKDYSVDTTVPGDVDGDGTTTDPNDPNTGDPDDTDNTDPDGNPTDDTTTIEGAPIISFPEDANSDGKLNAAENSDKPDTTPVQVTTPVNTEVGDKVVITTNNGEEFEVEVKQEDIDRGYVEVEATIPTDADGNQTDLEVNAYVEDPAGNTSHTATETLEVDTTVPGDTDGDGEADDAGKPVITIPEAEDGVNAEELSDGVQTNVSIPTGTEDGDTLTLTVTNPDGTTSTVEHTVTQAEIDAGTAEVTIPKDQVPTDGDYSVVAQIADDAGNESKPSDPADFNVDMTGPDSTTTQVTVDDVTADNTINAEEADGYVPVTGTVTGEFNDGDEVVLTINGTEYTGTVNAAGEFEIPVKGSDLAADSDKTIDAVVKATDDAGNVGEITATKVYETDVSAPNAPDVVASTIPGDGSVTVAPPADADVAEVIISYTDEAGVEQEVTATKADDGTWSLPSDAPTGVTIASDTGLVTIAEDAVKDGFIVTAVAQDKAGNESDPDSDVAGSDVLSAPKVTILDGGDEFIDGEDLVEGKVEVTVVLTEEAKANDTLNFNGETITVTQTMVDQGFVTTTIDVPDNAAENDVITATATITYADGSTSGEGKDTSKIGDLIVPGDTDGDGKPDTGPVITFPEDANGDGTLQLDENTTDPANTDVKIEVPVGSEVDDILYIKVNGTDLTPVTITQAIIDNGYTFEVPVDELVDGNPNDSDTTINDIKVEAYVQEPTVAGVEGSKSLTTSEILDIELLPASEVTSITLEDDFTDEYNSGQVGVEDPDAEALYNNVADYEGEVGNQALGSLATGLDSGLTNDATPTLDFSIDTPLLANQELVVTRYTITDGTEGGAEIITPTTTDGINYTYTETDLLPETYGQDYRYKVEIKTDGETVASRDFNFHLDTMVEALSVESVNTEGADAQLVLTSAGTSEVGGTIEYSYPTGAGSETGTVEMAADGTFTIPLAGFDRFNNEGLTYTLIDAAGNISDSKTVLLRNMFSQISTEVGPDPSAKVDGIGQNLGGFDDGYRTGAAGSPSGGIQPTTGGEEGGFVSTNGNDTFIFGLENFNGESGRNGSIASATGTNADQIPFIFDTGAGDDFILARGDILDFDGSSGPGKILMGEGNDKLQVDGNIIDGEVTFDMGEGQNIIHIKGNSNNISNVTYQFGNDNDLLRVDGNLDGTTKAEFGDGQNKLVARTLKLDPNSYVNFGKDDDIFLTSGNVYGNGAVIDLGDGNNTFKIGGDFRTNSIDDQASAQVATVTSGSGDDVFRINGSASINLDSGAGADSVRIDNNFRKGSITTGIGDDSVRVDNNFQNGTLSTGVGEDTINIANNFRNGTISSGDDADTITIGGNMSAGGTLAARPGIDTGAGDDVLTVEGIIYRADINMGEGNDTLVLGDYIYNVDGGNVNRVDMGAGTEDTVMLQGGNITYYARHFQNVNTFDMTEDTKQTLEIQIDDILNDDVTELFIKGDDLDVVDLGANGDSLEDNRPIGEEDGSWSKQDGLHYDSQGNTYHSYIFMGENGATNPEIVYIQDTITVI